MSANDKAEATYGPGRTTPPLEARVHFEVARVVTNVSNWPDAAAAHLLGRDLNGPINKLVAALLPVIAEAQAEALREAARSLLDDPSAAPATVKWNYNRIYAGWLLERADNLEAS